MALLTELPFQTRSIMIMTRRLPMSARTNFKLALLLMIAIAVLASAKDRYPQTAPVNAPFDQPGGSAWLASDDAWQPGELIQADELAQSLSKEPKPIVLQVGVIHLYRINHIIGSKFAG